MNGRRTRDFALRLLLAGIIVGWGAACGVPADSVGGVRRAQFAIGGGDDGGPHLIGEDCSRYGASECASGLCLDCASGYFCSKNCVTPSESVPNCPTGWTCQILVPGNANYDYCVPPLDWTAQPASFPGGCVGRPTCTDAGVGQQGGAGGAWGSGTGGAGGSGGAGTGGTLTGGGTNIGGSGASGGGAGGFAGGSTAGVPGGSNGGSAGHGSSAVGDAPPTIETSGTTSTSGTGLVACGCSGFPKSNELLLLILAVAWSGRQRGTRSS